MAPPIPKQIRRFSDPPPAGATPPAPPAGRTPPAARWALGRTAAFAQPATRSDATHLMPIHGRPSASHRSRWRGRRLCI